MKKCTLILLASFIIFACESDDSPTTQTPESDGFLVSSVIGGSNFLDYSYTYDASNKLTQMEILTTNNIVNFSYNAMGGITEIAHEPYVTENNDTITKKITFESVTENELIGLYQITRSSTGATISYYVKYKFDGMLIKSLILYDSNENDFRRKIVYTHDSEGKLTEIWEDENQDDYVDIQTVTSWDNNIVASTNPRRRNAFLAYFPNHYVSTKNSKNVTYQAVGLDTGHALFTTIFDYDYQYDTDGYTTEILRTSTNNLGNISTETSTIDYIPAN